MQYSANGSIALPNGTANLKRINTKRIPANGNVELRNPDEQLGDFYLTHGDYLLVTMQAKNATQGGASMVWGAEI